MDIAWAGRCLEPHRGFGLGAVVGAVSGENALFRFGRVVDDHPQALPKTLERPDDVGLVQIVGEKSSVTVGSATTSLRNEEIRWYASNPSQS